jgi:hypothetical protein
MDEDTKHSIDLNKDNLARTIGFVGVMDAKASFALSLVLALTAYLVTQLGPFLTAHVQHKTTNAWVPVFFIILDLMVIACLACFIAAVIVVIHAIKPRTDRHTGRNSPLFFGTIADMPCEDFKDRMKILTPNQYLDCLIDQTYDNAKIVRQKNRHLRMFTEYYHRSRTHLALDKDTPEPRPIQPPASGRIVSSPVLGGLHHRYERRAA